MSFLDSQGPGSTPNQTAGVTDVVTQLQAIVRQLTALVQATTSVATALASRAVFGTFTMTATVSDVILNTAVQSTSNISLSPTNASAGTLQGSAKALFISAKSPGVSFTVSTANSVAAAGTETFSYTINTPT